MPPLARKFLSSETIFKQQRREQANPPKTMSCPKHVLGKFFKDHHKYCSFQYYRLLQIVVYK